MCPTNSLREDHAYVNALSDRRSGSISSRDHVKKEEKTDLNFDAFFHVRVLGDGVRHDQGLKRRLIDPRDRGSGKDTVRQDGVHFVCTSICQLLSRVNNGPACIRHVIDQNGRPVLHVTHQDHGCHFVRLLSLLVNQGEVDVQSIGDGRDSLCATSVRGNCVCLRLQNQYQEPLEEILFPVHFQQYFPPSFPAKPSQTRTPRSLTDDTRLPVCYVLADPFENRWLCIQVVDWNVKEPCATHGNEDIASGREGDSIIGSGR